MEKKKNPWIAGILSFLIPGLGHVYLRKWKRAAAWFFGTMGLGIILFIILTLLNAIDTFADRTISRILTGGIAFGCAYDAYVLAKYSSWKEYTRQMRKKK